MYLGDGQERSKQSEEEPIRRQKKRDHESKIAQVDIQMMMMARCVTYRQINEVTVPSGRLKRVTG